VTAALKRIAVLPTPAPDDPAHPPELLVDLLRAPLAKSNHYEAYTLGGKARIRTSPAARAFQDAVAGELEKTTVPRAGVYFDDGTPVEVEALITYPKFLADGKTLRAQLPDADGGMKAIMDAGQDAGVYSNDRQVCRQSSSRRPGSEWRLVLRFAALDLDGGWLLPSVAGRKEWAERQRGDRLDEARPDYVPPGAAVARCWNDDILIGPHRHEQEIWLFVAAPGKAAKVAGAVVCGACARELGLTAAHFLMTADELDAHPHDDRAEVLAARSQKLLGPRPVLLFARAARDLIRRRRIAPTPDTDLPAPGDDVLAALDRLDDLDRRDDRGLGGPPS
jgi:Holliday junction resolvase RusA-like endonuclease